MWFRGFAHTIVSTIQSEIDGWDKSALHLIHPTPLPAPPPLTWLSRLLLASHRRPCYPPSAAALPVQRTAPTRAGPPTLPPTTSFAPGQRGLPLPPQPLPPRPHYRKSHSCHEPSVLPWPFCRAHGKIVFCRRPDLKLTADRAAHGKKGCREGLSANKYFVVSFLWPTTAWYFAQSSSPQRDVLSWVFFLADDKMIFAINWNQISK
jgi:hypothetical protein